MKKKNLRFFFQNISLCLTLQKKLVQKIFFLDKNIPLYIPVMMQKELCVYLLPFLSTIQLHGRTHTHTHTDAHFEIIK